MKRILIALPLALAWPLVVATALLHGAGLLIALALNSKIARLFGGVTAVAGLTPALAG